MQSWAQDSYLTTEVMTASPQRLQLLLIEAAIRFAERGRLHWQANETEQACESLIRAQDIVSHILGGLRSAPDRGLAKKMAAVYVYIFRSLTEANLRHDEQKLDEALRVLEVERGTWQQVCEQLGNSQESESTGIESALPPFSDSTTQMPALDLSSEAGESYTGFSLEA
jgi:flagellar protein FliS